MRWQPVAAAVVSRQAERGWIDGRQAETAMQLVESGPPIEAFQTMHRWMCRSGWSSGWNKVWRQGEILAWCGPTVVVQPLRAAALAVESDALLQDRCRRLLTSRWRSSEGEQPPGVEDSKGDEPAVNLLAQFGIDLKRPGLEPGALELLQRLNLDTRERPFVERWRWSQGTGLALLSNGGRFQVRRELVWARAIEAGLCESGGLGQTLRTLLGAVEADHDEISIPMDETDRSLMELLRTVELYGFARRRADGIKLTSAAGDFPALALKLWGEVAYKARTSQEKENC